MPIKSGAAFIVAQHLANEQESILHELIQRHTSIAVHPIIDGVMIEAGNVYVLPAGQDLFISDGQLQLTPREPTKGWPKTFDTFLKSLAYDQGEWSVAIILSGVGNDGLEGSKVIKQEGGIVIAQDIESATQIGMPSSIIDTGLADAILPADQMPWALIDHFNIEVAPILPFEDLTETIDDKDIDRVIRYLQRQTGHNFIDYKRSTLRRQIARRMGTHQSKTVDSYLKFILQNPDESEQLAKYLLINVTSFFRNPDSFEALKQQALIPALRKLNIDTIFRVWVPGCSSGEEAVSIAILIYECLRELNMLEMEVRIFATDVNRDILQQPRSGFFPLSIDQDINQSRLHDYFIKEEKGYRVRAHITRMIIWSEHNLAENPPFSGLHLISCRNVLIYFQKRLQERVIALFQFGLQPQGILFLGTSETLPHDTDAFITIDSKHKIFQRLTKGKNSWLQLDRPLYIRVPNYAETLMPEASLPQRDHEDSELEIIRMSLVEHYASTCAIVDEQYRVHYTYGEIDRYLKIAPGREGQRNILDMARQGLDVELTIALHQAFESDETIVREGVWVKTNGHERIINLIIKPINHAMMQRQQYLIIFELSVTGEKLQNMEAEIVDGEVGTTVSRLREEILQTQKALQNVTQALQAKSEELTSSMEEIHSANEEIQTTNEELRTSKEELESMNEELNTLNTQLTDQNFELFYTNNTLHNFLQSADVGIIFLDQNLVIREYTSAITNIFGLRPSDRGRPLVEIANQLVYDDLISEAEAVLDTLNNLEREVYTTDRHWYNLRIHPYRTTNNVIDGIVLTFSDITVQKQAQLDVEQRSNYVRQIFDIIENSLIELDFDFRVVGANQPFYTMFQTTAELTIGQSLYDLGSGEWDIPELRNLLPEIISNQLIVRDYVVTHEFPNQGVWTMRLNARQVEGVERILLIITDISIKPD